MMPCEKTGINFNLASFLEARLKCISMVDEIIKHVSPGISEKEGQNLIKECFYSHGIEKNWHPSKFRIAADTTKSFRELPDAEIRGEAGDICFIDVGPIINQHEADYGRTFIIGGRPAQPEYEKLVESSEKVFHLTADYWRSTGASGVALFSFAQQAALSLGYQLNPLMAGHRLGDFPHQVFSSQKLFEFDQKPTENLWVLEILLLDESLLRGAFFEDILLS